MNFNKYKKFTKEKDIILTNKLKTINLKKLKFNIKKSLGRDKNGQLLYHRGGGVKKLYRLINSDLTNKSYRILQINYDPYRSSFINLIQFKDGSLSYSLSSSGDNLNTVINNFNFKYINNGKRFELLDIPPKSIIHNVELTPGDSGKLARSAGSFCKVFKKDFNYCDIILPSGEKKTISITCKATLGISSNIYKKFNKKYKAGTSRYLNKRPIVRGVAMNPIDHPHGGGEGKSSSGRPCVSPWGKLTKNVPTRKNK